MPFQPGTELVAAIDELRTLVDACLVQLAAGGLPPTVERERIDLKEEPGRRGSGGVLLPGQPQSTSAASQLADEVACMANTPGGGALIVGVADRTGDLLGTELDAEWLRHAIYQRIDLAPLVEVRQERGIRLLVLLVPEAREPVEDTSDRLRWRVGQHCQPVDRGAWWLHREGRLGWDPMTRPTSFTPDDVAPGAITVARRYLARRQADAHESLSTAPLVDLLRRLGLLAGQGSLTQAGALLLCPSPRAWLTWTRLDVQGGEVLAAEHDFAGTSLLEQIARLEDLLDAANDRVTLPGSFSEGQVRLLPTRAAREALLNGIVHRDWHQSEPTAVLWVEADNLLEVVSPGGFVGGVTAANVLTQRFSRSPALADAVRALGLVDRQGIGVDHMFRDMVALGHRPPLLVEDPGPKVRVRLVGGPPVVPIMRLVEEIEPAPRRRDVQIALIVHTLLHNGFTTPGLMAKVLQRTVDEARESLELAEGCAVRGARLVVTYRDVWMLSRTSEQIVKDAASDMDQLRRRGVLTYLQPDSTAATRLVERWLASHDRISSGDFAAVTGLTYAGSRRLLDRLAGEGLLVRGEAAGRNAHFLPGLRLKALGG